MSGMETKTKTQTVEGESASNYVTGYWQLAGDRRTFEIVRHGDRLEVTDYSPGYFAFGSVAGYALENYESAEASINRARGFGHPLVWINALASIIDNSGKTGQQKAMEFSPAGAKFHSLKLGGLVWLEGQSYRIDKTHNRNLKLTPVRVGFDGSVTEGVV
jgi:hypothetical protein